MDVVSAVTVAWCATILIVFAAKAVRAVFDVWVKAAAFRREAAAIGWYNKGFLDACQQMGGLEVREGEDPTDPAGPHPGYM